MSAYIKLADLSYPWYEGDIRKEHPEITEDQTGPTFPCPDTYAQVEDVPWPTVNGPLEYAEQGPPALVNGVWRMTWVVGHRTQEEWDDMQPRPRPSPRDPERLKQTGSAPDVD